MTATGANDREKSPRPPRPRAGALALAVLAATLTWGAAGRAQVSDAQRAVARQLFREGDELQRAGKFADALDKFQRAESAYSAPTNVLRIAECQAALGHLAESAEAYRTTIRMAVPAGSPPALQAAVDQAKTELAQVEPRVPKLLLQVMPANVPSLEVRIDGQRVSDALIGEAIPLDPGEHKVEITAPGYAAVEQLALLKERETTPVSAQLQALLPPPPAPAPTPTPLAPAPAPAPAPSPSSSPPPASPSSSPNPPLAPAPALAPAPIPSTSPPSTSPPPSPEPSSRMSLLVGGHLGWELAAGQLPTDTGNVDATKAAASGFAYALEAGLRFSRHGYVGLTLEHAQLGHGDLSTTNDADSGASTTLLGATIAFIGNADRVSFYGEIGAALRWLSLSETRTGTSTPVDSSFNSGELTLGLGIWIPAGPSVRLLPEITLGLGAFDPQSSALSAQGHSFFVIGMAGYYSLDL